MAKVVTTITTTPWDIEIASLRSQLAEANEKLEQWTRTSAMVHGANKIIVEKYSACQARMERLEGACETVVLHSDDPYLVDWCKKALNAESEAKE